MTASYRRRPLRRLLNVLVRPLARLGLAGKRTHVLTVVGRRSGKRYSTPVLLVFLEGERWLVAPAVPVALGVLVPAVRRVGAPHRSWRFSLAMLAVFPVTWLVIQAASYVLFFSVE